MGALTEEAIVRLTIQNDEATSKFVELKNQLDSVKKEWQALKDSQDKWTDADKARYKELTAQKKELSAELKSMSKDIDINAASTNQLNEALRYWTKEAKSATIGTDEWIQASLKVNEIKARIKDVTEEMKTLGDVVEQQVSSGGGGIWSKLSSGVMSVFTGMALWDTAKAAATAIYDFGKEVFETTAKFEKYEAILGNALRSQTAAAKAMDDIKKLAASTPFSVDELTESYVKYINRGLKPTMEDLTKLGDIAASQGKSFDQLTEAVLDAGTGEFERLKEFGIQASKSGDQVSLSFKGITQTVSNTPDAINKAILSFGEMEGVAGTMAITSATLEGRMSNLGDKFDNIKLIIGEYLKPVFTFLLDAMSYLMDVTVQVITGSEPLIEIFKIVYSTVWSLVESLWSLTMNIISLVGEMLGLESAGNAVDTVMKYLSGTFRIAQTAGLVFLTTVQLLVDSLNFLMTKGKEVANFFGADFKIDPKANFDTLKNNAEKNFNNIKALWSDTSKSVVDTHGKATDKITDDHAKATTKQSDKAKKEAEKQAAERLKAEADMQKRIEDMQTKAIADETARKVAEIKLAEKRQEEEINKSKASTTSKQKAIELLHAQTQTAIDKVEADARAKKEKAEKEVQDKISKFEIDSIVNASEKKKAEVESKAKNELATWAKLFEDKKITEEQFAKIEANIANKKKADIEAIEKKTREDKAKAEDKERADKYKKDKQLFDDTFKLEVEQAKLDLALTKNTAKAQFDAKLQLINMEHQHKMTLLKNEADREKEKVRLTIDDATKQKEELIRIDNDLNAKLKANDIKLREDTVKLNQETNTLRQKNNKEFFDNLDKLYQGDFSSFMAYLQKKVMGDKTGNDQQLNNFTKKAGEIADVASQAIAGLKKLNDAYTKNQLDNLNKEKNAALKVADDKLDKLKEKETAYQAQIDTLTKEKESKASASEKLIIDTRLQALRKDLDTTKSSATEAANTKDRINKEYAAKELAIKKQAFERDKKLNIANAIIAGAMASLRALASGGFPLGLVFAAITAGLAAVQIGMISSQQFQGAKGGVFKNAGVAQGSLHGAKYGDAGIQLIDRVTGREVGEIEGNEPVMVLSRNTYSNNKPIIDKLLHSSLYRNGEPIMARSGAVIPYRQVDNYTSGLYQNGGVIRRFFGEDGGVVSQRTPEVKDKSSIAEHYSKLTSENTAMTAERLGVLLNLTTLMVDYLKGLLDKPTLSVHDIEVGLSDSQRVSNRSSF